MRERAAKHGRKTLFLLRKLRRTLREIGADLELEGFGMERGVDGKYRRFKKENHQCRA
jgi:hypothetical protein